MSRSSGSRPAQIQREDRREVALGLGRAVHGADDSPLTALDRERRDRDAPCRLAGFRSRPPIRACASRAPPRASPLPVPVASIAWSTPPPVSSQIASAVASGVPCQATVCAAPKDSAAASFRGSVSTATTGSAPAATAAITADNPTPPHPITATLSPGRTPAVFHTEPTPVVTAQPTSAATSSGTPSGTTTQERLGDHRPLRERREAGVVEHRLAAAREPGRPAGKQAVVHRGACGGAQPGEVADALCATHRTTATTTTRRCHRPAPASPLRRSPRRSRRPRGPAPRGRASRQCRRSH